MALFWKDAWLNSTSLMHIAPALVAAVAPQALATRTVEEALTNRRSIRDITGPLSVRVLSQFLLLVDALQDVHLTPDVPDRVVWKWTSSASYSASSAYRAFFAGLELFPCGKTIWKTWAPAKCKVHIWLAMQRRLWTADRMLRRDMNSHIACPLCDQDPETADHLALGCVFAREIWHTLLRRCDLSAFVPGADDALIDWWPDVRLCVPSRDRKGFDSLVLLIVWSLWKERNSRVFERTATTASHLCRKIADEWSCGSSQELLGWERFGSNSLGWEGAVFSLVVAPPLLSHVVTASSWCRRRCNNLLCFLLI
ncbi:unnamed protein product [Alopecurus aequalis]